MEAHFATLIGGHVNKGSQIDKKDVVDANDRTHSIKSGKYWQIFLYRRSRLKTNTALQGLGRIADFLIAGIDAFPEAFDEYRANKIAAKTKLQKAMHHLCCELQEDRIRSAFFERAVFNTGEVNYLTVKGEDEKFHVFPKKNVVKRLTDLSITNSRARHKGQMDALKVLLKDDVNIGEIEVRADSKIHYQEVKFRLNGHKFLGLLQNSLDQKFDDRGKVLVYGDARKTFRWDPMTN